MTYITRMGLIAYTQALLCLGAGVAGPPCSALSAQGQGTTVAINEFMAANQGFFADDAGDHDDWIELYNYGDEPVDVGGMYLTDDVSSPAKWRIPTGNPSLTTISPKGFLVVWADGEPHEGPLHAVFRLTADGEQVALYDRQQRLIDAVSFGTQHANISYGRLPDGGDDWRLLGNPTPGKPNQAARSDVVITEIMYHPAHESGPENRGLEYIELFNSGDALVNLAGWRFSDGVEFSFPHVELAAGAYLVVAADVNEFSVVYPDVENVIGGWSGSLSNSGERIELVDDGAAVVDWVRYADEGDWSVRQWGPPDHGHRGWIWSDAHDGGGWSLELIDPAMPNELGANWALGGAPWGTPGRRNSVAAGQVAPIILDVAHVPIIPGSSDTITVTARIVSDSETPADVRLHYRVDASTADDWHTRPQEDLDSYHVVPMADGGADGDGQAGDGVYAGQIAAHPDGTILEFFVEAIDAGGRSRTWPAAGMMDEEMQQAANALLLVDDSFDPHRPAGSQPLYHLVMLERERAELAYIGSNSSDSASYAQMNGTFISADGSGTSARYCVGIRNRGKGSRNNRDGSYRNNYRVNFRHDRVWNGVTALNINNRYGYLQLLGSALWRMADLPAAHAAAVQLRVNGRNLAMTDRKMYGAYVAIEVIDADFAKRHFPDDPSGNVYRCTNDRADLGYRGTDPDDYRSVYEKQTNEAENDYSDLILLTDVLNNAPPERYVEEVGEVIHLSQWLRFLAVDSLAGNLEGGLNTPRGDDYALYSGVRDPRFWLIPHDLDTLLGQGDRAPDLDRDIHVYAGLDGLHELLSHPQIIPMYHQQFIDLTETVFAPERFDPLVDQMLGGWVPPSTIDSIKQFVRQRNAAVLAQISQE